MLPKMIYTTIHVYRDGELNSNTTRLALPKVRAHAVKQTRLSIAACISLRWRVTRCGVRHAFTCHFAA